MNTPELSLVIPFYNEEQNVAFVLDEAHQVIKESGISFEILAVDDGSTDQTASVLAQKAQEFPELKVITLARNYGQTAALSAGFDEAQGKFIAPMDGDGQNDPRDIKTLLEKMEDSIDVISGWRRNRAETQWSRLIPSQLANRLISYLSRVHLHDYGCTLKLYRRDTLKAIHLYGEMHRLIPIFIHNEGGKIIEASINHRQRHRGVSKYGLNRTFKVLMDLVVALFFTSLRDKPIYLFGGIGLIEFALGTVFILTSIIFKMIDFRDFVETPLPLAGFILIVLGTLTALTGIHADITMRTYFESQGKKPYRIRR